MITDARRFSMMLGLGACLLAASPARAGLDEYLKRDDGAFAWKSLDRLDSPAGTIHSLKLTSQVWQEIRWEHSLRIFEPAEIAHPNAVLLYITGGNTDSKFKPEDALLGFGLARACGARCAVLAQVPNQPLLGGKHEDALIAETFVRYLETKDETWPLLFPMVKSAVRALDAIQDWAKKEGKPPVTRFVVAGASKRGWTTWLTGAVDPRVSAIAPMVIDTLNMKAQREHSLEVWGKFSEQINDYTSRGLTERFNDANGDRLWKMVDPYSYRDRLTMPKLLIFGTNDRYWTLDALNIYWDDLKGPKSVVYLPNAGHSLAVNRDYAVNGVGALLRYTVSNRPLPEVSWKHSDGDAGILCLWINASPAPRTAKLWVARSHTRDFREATWESKTMSTVGEQCEGEVPRPAKGFIALVGDVEYAIEGVPFHLSTQIRQTGARIP